MAAYCSNALHWVLLSIIPGANAWFIDKYNIFGIVSTLALPWIVLR